MSLYQYKKAPQSSINKDSTKNPITIATILDNLTQSINNRISQVKPISFIVPLIFIVCGTTILYSQAKPYAIHFIQAKFSDKLNQEIIPLVPESYEEIRASYIFDPGASYFSGLLHQDESSELNPEYEGIFYITIEKANINRTPITANVDSNEEKVYQKALSKGLAHFKGTYLPGGIGNVLVYGHSAAGDYAEKNPTDNVTAFTRLFKLNIGDKITVDFNEIQYNYIVKKIKEVNPEDVEILTNSSGKTLTLMTCSPPGLNSKRLVVTAIQQ
jgi:LPXTG-site transpeptidase (sortase) family protein